MIPHSRPFIDARDREAVDRVLATGMLTGGERVGAFESAMCSYLGSGFAAGVSSGTAAIHLALRALGAGPGDDVVIPAYVCSSLLHAVALTGASPVIADSGDDLHHCDAATIKRVLTARTRAVVFPHLFGAARDISDIVALGTPVIEDCAMSLGSEFGGVKTGALGSAAAVFSFYTTKVIAAGEGGMVVSGDSGIVDAVRDMADYADKVDDVSRFNFTMTDMAAALGLSQLGKLPAFIERRRELAGRYSAAFRDSGLDLPEASPGEHHIFYRYVVLCGDVPGLRSRLDERGVRAERPVFAPLTRHPGISFDAPRAGEAWRTSLSIPLYPALTDEEAGLVMRAVVESAAS